MPWTTWSWAATPFHAVHKKHYACTQLDNYKLLVRQGWRVSADDNMSKREKCHWSFSCTRFLSNCKMFFLPQNSKGGLQGRTRQWVRCPSETWKFILKKQDSLINVRFIPKKKQLLVFCTLLILSTLKADHSEAEAIWLWLLMRPEIYVMSN